jgi:hypothetical protein
LAKKLYGTGGFKWIDYHNLMDLHGQEGINNLNSNVIGTRPNIQEEVAN